MLYIKRIPNGKMSNHLAEVEVGKHVNIYGPYGKFILDKSKHNKIYFIANDTRITPIKPLVYEALEKEK